MGPAKSSHPTPAKYEPAQQKPQPCGQGFACLRVEKGLAKRRPGTPESILLSRGKDTTLTPGAGPPRSAHGLQPPQDRRRTEGQGCAETAARRATKAQVRADAERLIAALERAASPPDAYSRRRAAIAPATGSYGCAARRDARPAALTCAGSTVTPRLR